MPCEIPGKQWEKVDTDLFTLNNSHFLCIADCHSIFPMVKRAEGLLTGQFRRCDKTVFAEYELPFKIMSDAGASLISDKFTVFCQRLIIEQDV